MHAAAKEDLTRYTCPFLRMFYGQTFSRRYYAIRNTQTTINTIKQLYMNIIFTMIDGNRDPIQINTYSNSLQGHSLPLEYI